MQKENDTRKKSKQAKPLSIKKAAWFFIIYFFAFLIDFNNKDNNAQNSNKLRIKITL